MYPSSHFASKKLKNNSLSSSCAHAFFFSLKFYRGDQGGLTHQLAATSPNKLRPTHPMNSSGICYRMSLCRCCKSRAKHFIEVESISIDQFFYQIISLGAKSLQVEVYFGRFSRSSSKSICNACFFKPNDFGVCTQYLDNILAGSSLNVAFARAYVIII